MEEDFKWRIINLMKQYWNLERIPPGWFSRSLLKCSLVDDSAKTVFLSYPEVKQLMAANIIAAFTPRGSQLFLNTLLRGLQCFTSI